MNDQPQPLWTGHAPGAVGDTPADVPTLTAYLAEKPTGAAMIVCPGGGYTVVVDHEKAQVAEWLNSIGIHAFVLVYRVAPRYRHPAMLHDVARAIRTVRANASQWNIDPTRIGVIGFSAGGHLASHISVSHDAGNPAAADPIDRVSSRPDAAVLVYPVISLQEMDGQPKRRWNLFDENPDPALFDQLSTELQVKAGTPPTFIYHRRGDKTVSVQHPLLYATALAKAGVRFELHVYDHDGHGQVWADKDPIDGGWRERLRNWLRKQNF